MNTPGKLGWASGYSITASDLTDELDVFTIESGTPRALRMDNGPEFISKDLGGWAREVNLVFIPPGNLAKTTSSNPSTADSGTNG